VNLLDHILPDVEAKRLRLRILVVTTLAYIGCFAVWTIFAIIGVEIQQEYGLSDTEFGLLVGSPFLSGSLMRVVLGVWADRHGGRRLFFGVMVIAAVATWFVADAASFPALIVAALGSGVAGGCSAVGLSYITRWYPSERHGTALGILGAGNTGSAITKLGAPWVMLAYGWHSVARLWARRVGATANTAQDLHSVEPGHAQIEEHGIGTVPRQPGKRGGTIGNCGRRVAEIRQRLGQSLADSDIVVDDQDARHAGTPGKSKANAAPWPTVSPPAHRSVN
jgi:hypothetical protein